MIVFVKVTVKKVKVTCDFYFSRITKKIEESIIIIIHLLNSNQH